MKKLLKIFLGLIVVGIITAILGYIFVYNKPHTDYEKEEAAFTQPANSLFNDFLNNKSESDEKYTGQVVQIYGQISKIEDADSFVLAVFVFSEGIFGDEGIRCKMLPEYEEVCRKINLNEEAHIKGFCVGYNETDVILEKCSVVKP